MRVISDDLNVLHFFEISGTTHICAQFHITRQISPLKQDYVNLTLCIF
jgi:hypothetical protein